MDFAALLHFAERRGVFFAPTDKKKATGLAVKSANQTKKLVRIHLAKVIDEGDGAIGSGGMNQETGRFIDNQPIRMLQNHDYAHRFSLGQKYALAKPYEAHPRSKTRDNLTDRVRVGEEDRQRVHDAKAGDGKVWVQMVRKWS